MVMDDESRLLVTECYSVTAFDTTTEMTPESSSAYPTTNPVKMEPGGHPADQDVVIRKSSAIEVELELLEPMWSGAIREENPEASEEQLQTLIDVKLDDVGNLIPLRNQAEKKFKDDCQMMDRIHENLTQILEQLRAKAVNDLTVRIEDYQARLLIKDWESSRLPIFETHYQEATRAWYKPCEDPLVHDFSSIMNNFAKLIAQFEYERSIRPSIQSVHKPDHTDPQSSHTSGPSAHVANTCTQMTFEPFRGDLTDPETLVKFAKWKRSWFQWVQELESKPNFNPNVLFKRLKESVTGPALALISKHPANVMKSYQRALDELIDLYEDPIQVAGYCIRNGTMSAGSPTEHVKAIKESMSALHNMRKVYESEKIDMYNFALIASFVSAMPLDLQAQWSSFKAKKKQEYGLMRESALHVGNSLPPWNAGMVENYETFNVWLNLQTQSSRTGRTRTGMSSTSAIYQESRSKNTNCFICGPESKDHHLTRCSQGLAMSLRTWRETCRRSSVCSKCVQPLKSGHKCNVKCRLCCGRRKEVDHHILMCPMSQFRTGPLEDGHETSEPVRKRSAHEERRTAKRSTEGTKRAKSDRSHASRYNKKRTI
ncbi:hypothetical protein TCAL_12074 [Tigriopus californicus]|uniref:Uncharacterized protein n=1 Tax=Tigriopus californicus TaxID=6832 RepID=A0A553PPN5_TIGCA|nr:uncharacterized protein LOC131882347 [Tigriopus californicus]TRY79640.1 hypothetical protein TCAL_12074 [Tigriopus californicus]|eukprot:TCALIF_12074-PA protein Name:"Protein of unknown function" AED:0.05 eAED:0.05 QI:0/-1/0/1/-1/1/1/0/598